MISDFKRSLFVFSLWEATDACCRVVRRREAARSDNRKLVISDCGPIKSSDESVFVVGILSLWELLEAFLMVFEIK